MSCLVAGAATGCLSSPPSAIRDGGADDDAGDGGIELGQCKPSPNYFGGASGDIDRDSRDDLLLLSGDTESGEIEVWLSGLDFEPRCVALDHLVPRGAVIADLSNEFAGNEVFVLAFTNGGVRRGLLFATDPPGPRLVATIPMGMDVHFSIYDRIDLVAVQGPLGWFFAYHGGHGDVSSPFTGDVEGLEWHELSDMPGARLANVLAVSLHLVGDDVVAFAATPDLVAWYDTSELPGTGPINAEDDVATSAPLEAGAFADLDLADGDDCPDLLGVYTDTDSNYHVIRWNDVVCDPTPVFGAQNGFAPAVAAPGELVPVMAAAQLDAGGQPDLVFVVRNGSQRVMRGMRNAHLDEVDGSECGTADAEEEACSDTGQELPTDLTSDAVSVIPIDGDADGEDEIILAGEGAVASCYELVAGDWQTCPQ